MSSRGIVLVATGSSYIEEAIRAARQLKHVMPFIPITAFFSETVSTDYIDEVIEISQPKYGFIDKVEYIYKSPYDETLFLDTDIYVDNDISFLFDLLQKFDIIAPYAPIDDFVESVPEAFQEMNTGVILFKKSESIKKCFSDWLSFHTRDRSLNVEQPPDQPAFREAVYKNNVKPYFLSHEYNCMLSYPVLLSSKVLIFHGRINNLLEVMDLINRHHDEIRVYIPNLGVIIQNRETVTIHSH